MRQDLLFKSGSTLSEISHLQYARFGRNHEYSIPYSCDREYKAKIRPHLKLAVEKHLKSILRDTDNEIINNWSYIEGNCKYNMKVDRWQSEICRYLRHLHGTHKKIQMIRSTWKLWQFKSSSTLWGYLTRNMPASEEIMTKNCVYSFHIVAAEYTKEG